MRSRPAAATSLPRESVFCAHRRISFFAPPLSRRRTSAGFKDGGMWPISRRTGLRGGGRWPHRRRRPHHHLPRQGHRRLDRVGAARRARVPLTLSLSLLN